MAKICLAMIVKDEQAVLRRCLESVKGKVDSYAILDTGSSRENFLEQQKIILDVLGPNGNYTQGEWLGFAGSRNHALRMGCCWASYVLSLDADETLEGDFPELTMPLYSIAVTNDGKTFNWRELLIQSSCPATWDGDIHEHIVSIHKPVKLEGVSIFHHHDGSRSTRDDAALYDRKAILKAMDKCSSDEEWERLCFMLGDTYIMDRKTDAAIDLYSNMALGMDNSRELVWNAIYRVAVLREMKRDDHHRIISSYKRAIDTRPYRIEPYMALAEYLKGKGDTKWATEIAQVAMNLEIPSDTFNVDISCYSKEYKQKFMDHIMEESGD